MTIDRDMLCAWACELGFAQMALCSIDPFLKEKERVESQPPLAERRQLRFSPLDEHPRGKSIAVMLWAYAPAGTPDGEELFVDSYYHASNAAYHAAKKLEERLVDAGRFAKANVSYPAKAAAVRAGLGWIGKNDLLFTKQFGTRVVIILMLTDIEPDDVPDDSTQESACLNCGRCVMACPSGALDENGMSHPERCMRNFMMEGVVVPEHLRERMGMRLLGCDLCQRACPMQPKPQGNSASQRYELKQFVTENQNLFSASISELAGVIGRNAARPQRVRAQAALLAGNSRNPDYLPVLRQWAQLPFEAVSEHARWAIGRLELESGGT